MIIPHLKNKKDKTFLDHWLLGEDLSSYATPWAHARLNIVEKILLGQRQPEGGNLSARHVKDLFDLIPPNKERTNHLFKTALKSRSLVVGDRLQRDLSFARNEAFNLSRACPIQGFPLKF